MRTFTIGEAAKFMGVAPSTLRYYDKEGLLPFVEKKDNGIRVFKESDLKRLGSINCMKRAGAPVADIKRYVELCMQGDCTLEQRLQVFIERRKTVQAQMDELNKLLETIDRKILYHQAAIAAGTEAVIQKKYSLEVSLSE